MALKLIEDFFEVGANPENIVGTNWLINGGRVTGSGAIGPGGTGQWLAYAGQGWATGVTDIFAGFALKLTASQSSPPPLFAIYSDINTTLHLVLTIDNTNRLVVMRGGSIGSNNNYSGGTVIGTSPLPFPVIAQWRSINFNAKIGTTDGKVVVKVDGITHIELSNVNTKNGGTSTLIDGVRVFVPNNASSGLSDLVVLDATGSINNTFPGDTACIRRLPNANGQYSEFMGSDGDQIDNYKQVDEAPSDNNDYNFATGVGQKDSYGVEDLPAATVSVLGVRAVAKCAKSGAGSAGMSVFVREGATNTFGPSVPLSTSFSWQGDSIREVAPSTGAAWTVADVNAMEIGVRSEAE